MITFASIITTLFFSTIYILFLAMLSRNKKLYFKLGLKKLILLSLLVLFHIFLPIALPAVTHNVHFNRVWPEINQFLYRPRFMLFEMPVTIMKILSFLWTGGAVVCMGKLMVSYVRHGRTVAGYRRAEDAQFERIITQVNADFHRNKSFTVVIGKTDTTPYLFGMSKPYIVIPQIGLSEEEWRFVFRHEMAHYYQGDLLVRFFLNFAHAVYWWNPMIRIFQNQLIRLQEINTDFNVIEHLDNRNKLKYMECLGKLALFSLEDEADSGGMAAFHYSGISTVTRIQLMYENFEKPVKPRKRDYLLMVILFLFVLVLPYVVALEPHGIYIPDAPDAFLVKRSDYFIRQPDGTYDFYLDGEYTCNIDFIFDDMPEVYDCIE